MTIPRYPQRGELVLPLREKLFWWWRPGQENATFEEFPARVYVAGGHRLDMIWRIKPAIPQYLFSVRRVLLPVDGGAQL